MITIVTICEAYTKPSRFRRARANPREEYSIYILPGSDGEFETASSEDYEDWVQKRAVLVAARLGPERKEAKIAEIRTKFEQRGFEVFEEFFVND